MKPKAIQMADLMTVAKKEILDAIRDGKALAAVLIMPLFLACVPYFTLQFVVTKIQTDKQFDVHVQGLEFVAPLKNFLQERGLSVVPAPEDYEAAIQNGELNVVIVARPEFSGDFREQRQAELEIFFDSSRNQSETQATRLEHLLRGWSTQMGALRLFARSVDPRIAKPVEIRKINLDKGHGYAAKVLASMPMFLLLIAFATGIGITAEMASGERERRSLEALLITPVSYSSIYLGKWAAACLIVTPVLIAGALLQYLSLRAAPLQELGLRFTMNLNDLFLMIVLLMPLVALASALQLLTSFFARSFKDAQSYNGIVMFLPLAPVLYISMSNVEKSTGLLTVPIMGTVFLLNDIIGGKAVLWWELLIAVLSSSVAAVLLIFIGVAQLRREKSVLS